MRNCLLTSLLRHETNVTPCEVTMSSEAMKSIRGLLIFLSLLLSWFRHASYSRKKSIFFWNANIVLRMLAP